MNSDIVSSTDLQRDIKEVLSKLNTTKKPLVVVRDSKPTAVLLTFAEYRRLSDIERQLLKSQMEDIWADMRKRNANVSDKKLDKIIEEAKRYVRGSR